MSQRDRPCKVLCRPGCRMGLSGLARGFGHGSTASSGRQVSRCPVMGRFAQRRHTQCREETGRSNTVQQLEVLSKSGMLQLGGR